MPVITRLFAYIIANISPVLKNFASERAGVLANRNRKEIEKLLIDGAADNSWLYKRCFEEGIDLLTPPQKNACKHLEPWISERNNRLLQILGLRGDKIAKSIWSKLSGYSRRVTVESAIAGWKRLHGNQLKSRRPENQSLEVRIKVQILNKNLQVA